MYLRISNSCVVKKSDIIGIFDMDNTTVSRQGRDFLPRAERDGSIVYTADELPKSYVVTEHDGKMTVYLSSLSSKVLINRAKSPEILI
ncbi:MAG: extracellular matrix regulator RemB [Candidatus Ornithomonoglobus sp.]